MEGANTAILHFAEEYMGKLFYFCLKKTGQHHAAEDLSQEIALAVCAALRRGNVPQNFPAWVWQIAKNRYSRWAAQKHRDGEFADGNDISDYELTDDTSVEEELIEKEDQALLRRELSFIAREYRELLVAYYLENESTTALCRRLSLPKGTVISRLYRARNLLKEGMTMAREFGERSYNPEKVWFISSGNQPSGLPFSAVERKLPVNILCTANNNPSTIEELAMEMGIAMPYMEEEVSLLTKAELLKALPNGKYLTSFFIAPREFQNELNELASRYAETYCERIWSLSGKALAFAKEYGVMNGTISDNDAQMYLSLQMEAKINRSMFEHGIYCKFHRADGGNWGFIGHESGAVSRPTWGFSDNEGYCRTQHYRSLKSRGFYSNDSRMGTQLYKDAYGVPSEVLLMFDTLGIFGEESKPLTAADTMALDKALEVGFAVKDEDGKILPRFLIFRDGAQGRIMEALENDPEYMDIKASYAALVEEERAIFARFANPHLEEDRDYYIAMSLNVRAFLARALADRGFYRDGHGQFAAIFVETK